MATYCTEKNLIDRFGEKELIDLTDRNGLGSIDSTVVDAAISGASADIDSYIMARYDLPLPEIPRVLQDKCEVLARYRLFENQATEQVQKDRDDAIKWLRDVQAGRASLGVDLGGDEVTAASGIVVSARTQVFDSDWADDYG